MKIAIVYDRINKVGGAERILTALHELYPDAPFYTSVFDSSQTVFAKDFAIRTSFIQHIPFAKRAHEWFAWLTPLAFELFDFHGFDAVISVTSAEAKSIITPPHVCHICYCLTPTRYLWSGALIYEKEGLAGKVLRLVGPILRRWDLIASTRPDVMAAISQTVAKRIEIYYRRTVESVIYPPADTEFFAEKQDKPKNSPFETGSYLLSVGRLVSYKRFDSIIDACTKTGIPLLVIGQGSQEGKLRSRAGQNVRFITTPLTDDELRAYYHDCRGFVFGGVEDFGIVAVEAQAAGKGILVPEGSGMAEVCREGVTGMTFGINEEKVLEDTVTRFFESTFDPEACKRQAQRFSKKKFMKIFRAFVQSSVLSYNRRI